MTNFEQIAGMLGVKINEPFKLKNVYENEEFIDGDFVFNKDGFYIDHGPYSGEAIEHFYKLISCELEIDRWPQVGDNYYAPSFKTEFKFSFEVWNDSDYDYSIKKCVGVYRTKEEAQEKARELGWLDD